jgi:hypothetical protein
MKLIIPKTYILENLKLEKNSILLIFKLLLSRNFLSLPIFQEKNYLTFLLALTFYCSIFRKIIRNQRKKHQLDFELNAI